MTEPRNLTKALATHARAILLLFAPVLSVFAACTSETYPAGLWAAQHRTAGADSDAAVEPGAAVAPPEFEGGAPQLRGACVRASAQPLPARLVSMSAKASTAAGTDLIYVSDLFERFKSICGNCHGPAVDPPGLGGYQIRSANNFLTAMTAAVLTHIQSDGPKDPANPSKDPYDPMPPLSTPNGGPYSKRTSTDPVKQLGDLVAVWLAAGSPQSFSATKATGGSDGGGGDAGTTPSDYLVSPIVGNTMTNIGDCIPSKAMVGIEKDKSATLDAMFAGLTKAKPGPGVTAAQMIGLPEHLADTDMFTLDAATLAQYGVVAFQPAYPLWSDDAGKLRFVRAPRGTSIRFNKDTQEFTIPPNTRFYKTFLKKIIDTDGSYRFRKIETRLIVARPDQPNPDGTSTVTALFGSYLWNANETEATLIETPLRNGLPFADTLLQYTSDEQVAADVLASKPLLPLEALLEGGAARHYAVPSSERCIQCHMGSNSATFILGFRPVQIKRRALGEGGILAEPGQKPPGPDELTQFQRLIDYGIIAGITSLDDVLPLERSEGTRAPRNGYELAAQGYMVGNCAHCHNPRGFPSVTNSVLKDILNFLPGPTGGVFQFPLERYSPRIGRGPGGGEPIPYVTPSLMDLPSAYWNSTDALLKDNWFYQLANGAPGDSMTPPVYQFLLYAPWRSLIYRNVDTPFAYETNLALFPHMPMNTPGYDCRAKQIMSDWMVSIPSIRKNPEIPEYAFASSPGLQNIVGGSTIDDNPQPYVEVLPGSPLYADAQRAADARLKILRTGVNPDIPATQKTNVYTYCPDTSDIVDPAVTVDPVCHAVPTTVRSSILGKVAQVTPARPHWVNTDLTQAPQAPGKFAVRRSDWQEVLVQQKFQPPAQHCATSLDEATVTQNEVKLAVSMLQNVTLDDTFRTYATTDAPFGLWQQKAGCHFSSVPTAGSFVGDKRPLWMGQVDQIAPTDPVYMASPGAAVFGMICVNCHGPNVDAHGRLSDNLATMTGGNAIVANFKDGFFGPVDSPGLHRQEAFATSLLPPGLGPNWTNVTVDDRAARYLAFMALGGTEVQIPNSILTVVGDTRVFGVKRSLPSQAISANMLSAAKAICASLLSNSTGASYMNFDWTRGWFDVDKPGHLKNFGYLIPANGDAELWLRLCSVNNPPPVRVIRAFSGDPPWAAVANGDAFDLIDPNAYGPIPVGNQTGKIDPKLTVSNLLPWCVPIDPPGAKNFSAEQAFAAANGFPVCPVTLPCPTSGPDGGAPSCWSADRMDQWATRGAINAGLAVYTYIDGLLKDLSQGTSPKPTYDQCDKLP